MSKLRIGQGFDVHAFCTGDHLMLCGQRIPFNQGFAAHSDGDVAIHALCDALYGAMAEGDIGQHFPDTDPAHKNRDSRDFLDHAIDLMQDKGFALVNADLTLIAQRPKLMPHLAAMKQTLCDSFQCAAEQINLKATTTEKLGFTGREEGIAVLASVLLEKNA